MKRIVVLILTLAMIAAFAAGCQNSGGTSPTSSANVSGAPSGASTPPTTGSSPSEDTSTSQPTVSSDTSPTQTEESAAPPVAEELVTIRANADNISLGGMDLHVSPGISVTHWQFCYEALMTVDKDTLLPVPNLAESYEVSDDGLVYTFHLRHGVQFHHGYGEMKASDVYFSVNRVRTEPMAQPQAVEMLNRNVDTYRIVDDYTFEVTLKEVFPDFLSSCTNLMNFGVMSEKGFEDIGGTDRAMEVSIGTGKFVFDTESWVPGQESTYLAFEDYWGEKAKLNVTMTEIKDGNAAVLAMQAGELDFLLSSQLEVVTQAEQQGARVDFMRAPIMFGLFFNGNVYEPFANPRVKEALCMAINRDANRLAVFGENMARAPIGVLPEVTEGWVSPEEGIKQIEYNPELAMEILREEGYENSLEFTAVIQNNVRNERIFTLIQDQFASIGVTMDVQMVSTVEYHDMMNNRRVAMSYASVSSGTSIFAMTNGYYRSGAITNYTDYSGIDDLIAQAAVTERGPERNEIYREMQFILAEDNVYFPHHFVNIIMVCSPRLHGVFSKGTNGGDLWFTDAYVDA